MYIFHKSMALFWTLTESTILYFMIWGNLLLHHKSKNARQVKNLFIMIFFILGLLLFFGEWSAGHVFDFNNKISLHLYRWILWNLFCTLWVIMEGAIMVYGFRTLKRIESLNKLKEKDSNLSKPYKKGGKWKNIFNPIIVITTLMSGLFILYHLSLISLAQKGLINVGDIFTVSRFYIRICGIFWILFEWAIAIICIRSFIFFRSLNEVS